MSSLTTLREAWLLFAVTKHGTRICFRCCDTEFYADAASVFYRPADLLPFSALIRPGRFDMQVTVPKPDVKGRTEILNWYLKKIKVDPGVRSASVNPEFGHNVFPQVYFCGYYIF